jgi:hypothetical protein
MKKRSEKPKPTNAVIDGLIRQSKQITADLSVLKHEIETETASCPPSRRHISEQRVFLISEQAYDFLERLRLLGAMVRGDKPTEAL